MRKKPPCANHCEKRTLTCHSFCKEYKEWKKEIEKENKARQQEHEKYSDPKRSKKDMLFRLGIK